MPRDRLPQLADQLFLTDTGLETDLIFHHGFDLPCFASFPLLADPAGRATLERYYREHAAVAVEWRTGFIFEAPTWRASRDWGAQLGYAPAALAEVNRDAIAMMIDLRAEVTDAGLPAVVSGCVGPRSDAYQAEGALSAAEAREFHREQIRTLAAAGADMVTALTIPTVAEAIGIVQAAADVAVPVAMSLTIETDGLLPDGTPLDDAVRKIDGATDAAAAYLGVNCAHPDHLAAALGRPASAEWTDRLRTLRANASRRSHAELDEAPDLDDGNPVELGAQYRRLLATLPALTILGGCCGTDARHLRSIAQACTSLAR